MSLLSPSFAIFTLATLLAFQLAPAWRQHVLLTASCLFYLSWNPAHALLLLALVVLTHRTALAVGRRASERGKLAVTSLGVAALLVVLAAFKCSEALVAGLRAGTDTPGLDTALQLIAPLGLSYYLFKLIGYLLDVYWDRLTPERSFASLALHASFFPQIVSGPIQRAGDFFGQLARLASPDAADVAAGLRRILFGVFKKVAIADRLAVVVAAAHADPSRLSSLELLIGAYAYALQLYADFSGLTDVALGLGRLFGIRGPENFDLPFLSRNLQEYWRRWHMSLTSWLTDYLFTPLRMSVRRLGDFGLALAIFVNMVAVGVWHGAAWTYAAFGALHGLLLVASALTLKRRDAFFRRHPWLAGARAVFGPLATFQVVVLALIVFRASSASEAFAYLGHLVPGLHAPLAAAWHVRWDVLGQSRVALASIAALAAAMEFVHWASRRPRWSERFLMAPRPVRWAAYYAATAAILFYGHFGAQQFIYAQF
jgi:D-alanyl-lipoteichoic acid acyltransferase DltB (MBOAT superfamily)